MTRRIFKITGILLLCYLIYCILCLTVPFARFKEVNDSFKDNFDKDKFYSDDKGVDRAQVVEDTDVAYDMRLRMIEEAKTSIILSTFSIKTDRVSKELMSSLYAAANRGVKIQILVDGVSGWNDMKDNAMYYAFGQLPNTEIRYYNCLDLIRPYKFNGRMHDKYVIIDDKYVILGGRNSSNYFLGNYNPKVLSYDRDIFVYNTAAGTDDSKYSVVGDVIEYFHTVWNHEESKRVYDSVKKSKVNRVKDATDMLKTTYDELVLSRPEIYKEKFDFEGYTVPTNKISLIYNPINIMAKEPLVWYQMAELMKDAKERVYIQSPYAVLNKEMYATLKEIGSDIDNFDLLLNSIYIGDNFMGSSDYKFNKEKVLNTGITVHEFFGEHSMHNKSILIDDDLSIIGSYNLDMRSTYLDTETMLVVHGKEFNKELEKNVIEMEKESLVVDESGNYVENPNVQEKEIPWYMNVLYSITSVVFQTFRFLL